MSISIPPCQNLPVHALFLVSFFEFLRLLREVIIQDRSVVFEIVIRNGKSARRTNLVNIDHDNASCPGYNFDIVFGDMLLKLRGTKFEYSTYGAQVSQMINEALEAHWRSRKDGTYLCPTT